MIYYIIDVRSPNAFSRSTELLNRTITKDSDTLQEFEEKYLYHFVYPSQSIRTIVSDTIRFILDAKLGAQTIDLIRLKSHGRSGYLQFGEGLDVSNVAEFAALAKFMKRDLSSVGVEIFGCGVASDTPTVGQRGEYLPGSTQNGGRGTNFLKRFANAVNRNVKAGLNI